MAKDGKRLTIGLLVSGIMDSFTESICRGAMQAAKMADVDMVVLSGKYLDRDLTQNRELMYEYQFNTIFLYAGKENLDALVVAADCISCFTTKERMMEMMQQYSDIPTVLVASKMEGYVSVAYDNYTGIKEGLEYLIHDLKYTKIGMIGGPEDNTDSQERRAAFLSVLEQNGIPFKDKMFVEGNLSRRCRESFCRLLDKNPDLEAVFCVNDDTALGLYDELKKRGIQPGKDIAVFGYDDTILAAKAYPSLSSVKADPIAIGARSLRLVLDMVRGEKVESEILPTKFVRRDSFRNVSSRDDEVSIRQSEMEKIDTYFDDIFYRYQHEYLQKEMRQLREAFGSLIEKLLVAFEGDELRPELYMDIQVLLDDFLNHGGMQYADMENLLVTFEKIYNVLKKGQLELERKFELRDMFSIIYRKIIRAMDHQFGTMREAEERANYSMKLFIRDMLQFEKGNDQSYASVLGNLEWMGIKNAYIYMLPKPVMHLFKENFVVPKELYLKVFIRDGRVHTVPALKQKKKIEDIFSSSALGLEDPYTMVLLPLFSGEMLYGVILCDLTDQIFGNGEFMINQMSSAIKMILLLKSNEEIQQQLEDSLVILKENNIVLDNLSKSDGLTGILNRRGFYDAAEELKGRCRDAGNDALVVYVDMNNLKIINDRYGHEEGDFSLKLIGETLEKVVKGKGIAGRIGGDEFACIMEYRNGDEGEAVLTQIYKEFEEYNRSSAKEYNVTVSAGGCLLKPYDNLDLKDALTQADEKLYEVKKLRTKEVAKNNK